jgi:hypothetical protein
MRNASCGLSSDRQEFLATANVTHIHKRPPTEVVLEHRNREREGTSNRGDRRIDHGTKWVGFVHSGQLPDNQNCFAHGNKENPSGPYGDVPGPDRWWPFALLFSPFRARPTDPKLGTYPTGVPRIRECLKRLHHLGDIGPRQRDQLLIPRMKGGLAPRTKVEHYRPTFLSPSDASQLSSDPDRPESATDQAIAAYGGGAREAVRALIVSNEFLEVQVAELQVAVSTGYTRGVPRDRKDWSD